MSEDLRALADVVHAASGIVLTGSRLSSLAPALRRIDPGLSPGDLLYERDPMRRSMLLDRLVDEVTVNETYFLRHSEELATIDWTGLLGRAAAAGRSVLRVWSAACSSGEEPYSLALLAAETLGLAQPPIDVLGTDISWTALARARRAVYGKRSMRLMSPERRERWFIAQDVDMSVGDELRMLVRFERHNLVRDPVPPGGEIRFDLIVCRNVLIYFDDEAIVRVRTALGDALVPGGTLLLGTVDRLGVPSLPLPKRPDARASQARRARSVRKPERPARRTVAPARSTVPPAPTPGSAVDALEDGMRALDSGDAGVAVQSLRRALYLDPELAVAALQLGRAHEQLGERSAARRAYQRALRSAEQGSDPGARLYDRVGAGDVAAACRARLAALGVESSHAS